MFFKKKHAEKSSSIKSKGAKKEAEQVPSSKERFADEFKKRFHHSADFKLIDITPSVTIVYFDTMIDTSILNEEIVPLLKLETATSPAEIFKIINIANKQTSDFLDEAIDNLLKGSILMHVHGHSCTISANIKSDVSRSLAKPENESQVLGAQVGFNENLDTNISLVRRYLTNPNLCNESFDLGIQTKTSISLLYIKSIADEQMVETMRQRITNLKIDSILDSSVLIQLVDDNSLSIFPQMVLTERPDRSCSWLLDGKLVVMVDGSTQAIGCPLSFIEFFQSMEDQNVRWHISTFLRILRIIAVFMSIFFTAVYVAALTFHYEIIPQPLLIPLSESRSRVPFPPIIEALVLEFTIELLREAGARLPTKVGQTMGIVGGIVVGTAAVDAGFTSNILIIIIALSALASFTTPSYMMGNVIRVLRFPLIILAGFWGFYGLSLGMAFLLIHLLKQSSLGTPFLAPFYPPRFGDWWDSIFRFPFPFTFKRPTQARPKDRIKYNPQNNGGND